MNLFSDLFMAVVLEDKAACAHVLKILTGIRSLEVIDIRVHHRVNNLIARDVIFDVLAQDEQGKLYNIEVQRADTVNHPRRVMLYVSELITEFSRKGSSFDEVPEVYIFYLSETDILHTGQCIDRVEKRLEKSGLRYDDGVHIAFANAEVDDGSEVANLMRYFLTADCEDQSQGALSDRVRNVKNMAKGAISMDALSKLFYDDAIHVSKTEIIITLMEELNITQDRAMDLVKIDPSEREMYADFVKRLRAEMAVTA